MTGGGRPPRVPVKVWMLLPLLLEDAEDVEVLGAVVDVDDEEEEFEAV